MTDAAIMDAAPTAGKIIADTAELCARLRRRGTVPGLALILAGGDSYAERMLALKAKRAGDLGIDATIFRLAPSVGQDAIASLIRRLNAKPDIHGIFVQAPLPGGVDASAVYSSIAPAKDVDGYHPINLGRLVLGEPGFVPCAALGGVALLKRHVETLSGLRAVVLGRSATLGKPLALLLLREGCTVTMAHSGTSGLECLVGQADLLATATGRPNFIPGSWLKPGCAVLDLGATLVDGRPTGDVDLASAVKVAKAINRPTGAIGPMTVAFLLKHTAMAAASFNGES